MPTKDSQWFHFFIAVNIWPGWTGKQTNKCINIIEDNNEHCELSQYKIEKKRKMIGVCILKALVKECLLGSSFYKAS